jgi:DNA-binding NarL/FixJ family response regulator
MKRLRVLIADDHPILAESLSSLFSADERFHVVGWARNGAKAVEMAESLDPDVILMDLEMPVMDGLEATRRITRQAAVRVLMFSGSDLPANAARARLAGAWGYLPKDVHGTDLVAAVLAAGWTASRTKPRDRLHSARPPAARA